MTTLRNPLACPERVTKRPGSIAAALKTVNPEPAALKLMDELTGIASVLPVSVVHVVNHVSPSLLGGILGAKRRG